MDSQLLIEIFLDIGEYLQLNVFLNDADKSVLADIDPYELVFDVQNEDDDNFK